MASNLFRSLLVESSSDCSRNCFFCPRSGDTRGSRVRADGSHVREQLPSGCVQRVLREAQSMGFRGPVGFHHFSEPFLDPRLITFARFARKLDMKPYAHTNTDVFKGKPELIPEADRVFDHIVIGLYDITDPQDIADAKSYWLSQFKRARIGFSCLTNIYQRTNTEADPRMRTVRDVQVGPCRRLRQRCIIHFDGKMAACCDDIHAQFDLGNALETPLQRLWLSPRHLQVIEDLERGHREPHELCSKCVLPAHAVQ